MLNIVYSCMTGLEKQRNFTGKLNRSSVCHIGLYIIGNA